MLGIGVPIFAAPMGFLTGPHLAAAVSNAGGLGITSFNANPPSLLREEIRQLRALTSKPFGVQQESAARGEERNSGKHVSSEHHPKQPL